MLSSQHWNQGNHFGSKNLILSLSTKVNSNTCRARLEDHGELPTLKNCKGLLATLEREPDSSQKQVMKLSEQKRVSERMVLLAISGLLTFTRIKYDPNQTAAPNASKYMDKIALKHQKNICHVNFVALKLYKFILFHPCPYPKFIFDSPSKKPWLSNRTFDRNPKFQVPERLSSYFTSTKSPGLDFSGDSDPGPYRWYVYHCKPIPKWVVYDIVLLTWDGFLMK